MPDRDASTPWLDVRGLQEQRRSASRPGESPPSDSTAPTRTSGSIGTSCRVCGAPITGRRRNGFCSDRCRLRSDRAAKRARLGKELTEMERKVEMFAVELRSAISLLRAEMLTDGGREEDDRPRA